MICTFRGVPFLPVQETQTSGRRVQLTEFPSLDVPLSVDLGRSARRWKLTGAVNGDNPLEDARPLLAALEAPGAGTLVHPTIGVVSVVVLGYESATSWADERTVTISMDLAESGEQPEPQPDPVQATTDTAAAVLTSASAWYEAALDLLAGTVATADAIRGAAADLRDLTTEGPFASAIDDLETLSSALDDFDAALVTLMGAPADYAASLIGVYESITDWRVLDLLLAPWSSPAPEITGGAGQLAAWSNAEEVRALNHRVALSSAAVGLSAAARGETFRTRNEALTALATMTGALKAEIDTADPKTGADLLALEAAITSDVMDAIQSLPAVETITLEAVTDWPTLVFDRFGSLDRLSAHLSLNDTENPLFVIGNVVMEIAP